MYIEDLKEDFYKFLAGKRIFVMINYDIDSICTCKILQPLMKFQHILYTISVVNGVGDLRQKFAENCKDVKYFILINCGGTIDLVDVLEPEDDIVFFVLDSHRPIDVCNIYSNGQIRILSSPDDDYHVPNFHDIFREDSDDDEMGEGEESDGTNQDARIRSDGSEEKAGKRRRLNEEEILNRRGKRLWEENRNKLMFEYTQFSYYAKASAIVMFNLAWKINRDDKELLWYAIIGLTEQLIFGKIENTQYVLELESLQSHVSRLENRTVNATNAITRRIQFEKDLKLYLYRHWSVEASFKYSLLSACKLKLWSYRGDKKLQELLADIGLPIVQSRQLFKSMDLQLRKEFYASIEKVAEKYQLQDVIFPSFTLQYGYRFKYCALDMVYILLAILESASTEKNRGELFNVALDCLAHNKKDVMTNGMEKSKIIAKTIFKTVQDAINMKQIITAGPFVYYIIQEGYLNCCLYSNQHILMLLSQFIQRAYVAMSRNRKAPNLPLIVSAPKTNGICIVFGVPPLSENSPKNFFGKAFQQAAERINCDSNCDYFDTCFFEIFTKDRTRFFDALTSILT